MGGGGVMGENQLKLFNETLNRMDARFRTCRSTGRTDISSEEWEVLRAGILDILSEHPFYSATEEVV